jgi:hypothetical protein
MRRFRRVFVGEKERLQLIANLGRIGSPGIPADREAVVGAHGLGFDGTGAVAGVVAVTRPGGRISVVLCGGGRAEPSEY